MAKPNRGLDPTVHKTKRGRPARVRPSKHFELPVQNSLHSIAAKLRANLEGHHMATKRALEGLLGGDVLGRMPTTYRAVDSFGEVHKRKTYNRTFTHCVVVAIAGCRSYGPQTLTEWCETEQLARNIGARWERSALTRDLRISGAIERIEVLPTEVVR